MSHVVVITPEELRDLIGQEIRAALRALDSRPPAKPAEPPAILDYAGAAEFTGLSESSLRRAVRLGKLRPAQTGCRSVRFRREDLERFLRGEPPAEGTVREEPEGRIDEIRRIPR